MFFNKNTYQKRASTAKKQVEKKFNRGKSNVWRNKDYEDLCFEINIATKVLISTATLKRIFGKNRTHERYTPQEATLEAMERYSGISEDFQPKVRVKIQPINNLWSYSILLFLVALISLIFIKNQKNGQEIKSAVLKLQKIEGVGPATAYFEYQVPKLNDSIILDYGILDLEDHIDPNSNHISQIYRYPGLFETKIKTRKKIISDTVPVFIPTNGWQALASYYEQPYTERYYPVPFEQTVSDGIFHPNKKFLSSIGMDTTQIIVLRIDNFQKTETNGDSFHLKSRLKNINFWPAIRCYSAFIRIVGEEGDILIKITNKGCSRWGEYRLSEVRHNGQFTDLSAFSVDMKNWNTIDIINKNKQVEVFIDGNSVFEGGYQKPIGNIVGLSVIFHGSGYVDFINLLDSERNSIFRTDF